MAVNKFFRGFRNLWKTESAKVIAPVGDLFEIYAVTTIKTIQKVAGSARHCDFCWQPSRRVDLAVPAARSGWSSGRVLRVGVPASYR